MNNLLNLNRQLYELKQTNAELVANNQALEQRLADNEENVLITMESLVEVYEMIMMATPMALDDEQPVQEVNMRMVMVYVTLILKGRKHLSDVPMVLQAKVEAELKALLEVEELPKELLCVLYHIFLPFSISSSIIAAVFSE